MVHLREARFAASQRASIRGRSHSRYVVAAIDIRAANKAQRLTYRTDTGTSPSKETAMPIVNDAKSDTVEGHGSAVMRSWVAKSAQAWTLYKIKGNQLCCGRT